MVDGDDRVIDAMLMRLKHIYWFLQQVRVFWEFHLQYLQVGGCNYVNISDNWVVYRTHECEEDLFKKVTYSVKFKSISKVCPANHHDINPVSWLPNHLSTLWGCVDHGSQWSTDHGVNSAEYQPWGPAWGCQHHWGHLWPGAWPDQDGGPGVSKL